MTDCGAHGHPAGSILTTKPETENRHRPKVDSDQVAADSEALRSDYRLSAILGPILELQSMGSFLDRQRFVLLVGDAADRVAEDSAVKVLNRLDRRGSHRDKLRKGCPGSAHGRAGRSHLRARAGSPTRIRALRALASPKETAPAGEQGPAAVGDTITLHGTESDLVMDVTLMEVIDPAKAQRFFGPGKNNRRR